MAEPGRMPLFTGTFIALTVADLAYFTAAGVSIFALPLYVTGPLGHGEVAAGFAFGVFAVSALVLRPFALAAGVAFAGAAWMVRLSRRALPRPAIE